MDSYKIKENWKGKWWFSRAKWISMFYVIKPCQAMSKCWHRVSTNNVWGLDRLSNEFSSLFRKTCNSAAQRILHTKLALPWYKKEMRKKKRFSKKKKSWSYRLVLCWIAMRKAINIIENNALVSLYSLSFLFFSPQGWPTPS